MPQLECPYPNCDYKTQDLPVEFAAGLNTALELHAKAFHTQVQQPAGPPAQKSLKLKSPTVTAGSSLDQWSAFKRQWAMYKTGMAIQTNMLATALFHLLIESFQLI